MAIAEEEPVPTAFADSFVCVDEDDADSAGFQAPKKENRWALLEVDNEQLALLEGGQSFRIQEHSMGNCGFTALCTPTATYGLEFLENSNPMYLGTVTAVVNSEAGKAPEPTADANNKENDGSVPNTVAGSGAQLEAGATGEAVAKEIAPAKRCSIFAQCRGHLYFKPFSGDVQRLRDLLAPHSVDGGMHHTQGTTEGDASKQPMTTSLLQYKVAASQKELMEFLEQGPYVERDGVWTWLPAAFEREVTDVALNLLPLHGWDAAAVDAGKLLVAVRDHFGQDGLRLLPTVAVLRNALRGIVSDTVLEVADNLAFDAEKIKLFQATQLLRDAPSRIRERFDLPAPAARPKRPRLGGAQGAAGGRDSVLQVEEFCAAFSALTGGEATIDDLSKLVGNRMYIDEMDGAVHTLDVTTLPQEPRERLKRLFELSSHWKPDRLAPLMAPVVHGVKIDVWLLKQCRTVYIEFEKGKEQRMFTKKFTAMA